MKKWVQQGTVLIPGTWGESMAWESQKRQNCSMISHAWNLMRFWSLDSETAPNIETLMKFGGVPLTLEMNVGIGADHSGRSWNAEWCRFTGVGKKLASYQLLCSNDSAEFLYCQINECSFSGRSLNQKGTRTSVVMLWLWWLLLPTYGHWWWHLIIICHAPRDENPTNCIHIDLYNLT